ncbi:hypothetical protein FNV43_RR24772 [Rhamnella rubrinervis]|uniref:Uncharacterized protein n=1 Tax=Rhamnella rubrinervis TaxID=2594499 RepID=A0A8K0DT82_9ROSA|nr:hypothetical protein FNV43_RR24772 [Rhamnella rubrinervis]
MALSYLWESLGGFSGDYLTRCDPPENIEYFESGSAQSLERFESCPLECFKGTPLKSLKCFKGGRLKCFEGSPPESFECFKGRLIKCFESSPSKSVECFEGGSFKSLVFSEMFSSRDASVF